MLKTILIALLTVISVGGVLVFAYFTKLKGERQFIKRFEEVANQGDLSGHVLAADAFARGRKRSIEKSLKEMDERQKEAESRRGSLSSRLRLAGLAIPKRVFHLSSMLLGFVALLCLYLAGVHPIVSVLVALVIGFFVPRRVLAFLVKRKLNKFTKAFPTGIDIISRGLKSGLPVGECIKIASAETEEPVRSEFRTMVQDLTIGLSMENTAYRFASRIPLSEANFFSTVMASQSKTGGSLSEALLNLSEVLRDRQGMRDKIKAMSSEVVASATIIGLMPLVVAALVYLSNPNYIEVLYTTNTGFLILIVSFMWMLTGIAVIRKMINFDF